MERIQAVISLDDGRWFHDYITVDEGQVFEDAVENYMKQYEQARDGLGIIRKLLPGIIHISAM